ncbi:MAG: hypothetical protein HKM05_11670 [Spirochaetales bacterium]|nr:hypothetical protein [Spirochaetales bacterium]
MGQNRYLLKTEDYLVLRDGKPFGSEKNWGSSSYSWLQPQTLTGMIRTAVGFAQSQDYFKSPENQKAILKVGVEKILPGEIQDGKCEFLALPPSDIIFTADLVKEPESDTKYEQLTPHELVFSRLRQDEGTDIANPDWLVPRLNTPEKPAKTVPVFWFWKTWLEYALKGVKAVSKGKLSALGRESPVSQERVHNALSSQTRTTEQGRLFANKDLYFYTSGDEPKQLCISFGVSGLPQNSNSDLSGDRYLGGDRKTVQIQSASMDFPAFPLGQAWENQKFLKLVLMTAGNWGSWCPNWLKPDLTASSIPFVKIPGKDWFVRLRSACVSGWEGVSGWDSVKRAPKAMKKLVKPSSVFLLEVQNPAESAVIAQHFWGSSLGEEVEAREGYGLVFPAVTVNQIEE